MRSRVEIVPGNRSIPILMVVPHGFDDTNTDIVAESASKAGIHAVINCGFQRSEHVDVDNDLADCNRIDHVRQPVVYDEFLKHILKICKTLKYPTIFHIHGVGNSIHRIANREVGVIVGYGLGKEKDSLTCPIWKKNLFAHLWRELLPGEVFEGSGDGKYAGRSSNNLNQFFRKHFMDKNVDSMQLEIPFTWRDTPDQALITGIKLGSLFLNFSNHTFFDGQPHRLFL